MYKIINENPLIVLKESFLSEKEINLLLEIKHFVPSRTIGAGQQKGTISNFRTSKNYFERNNEFYNIKQKVFDFLKTLNFNYGFENYEKLQVLKYEVGDVFNNHHDYFNFSLNDSDKIEENERVGTVLIYLKKPKQGGETYFNKLNIKVSGNPGDLLFFRYDNLLRDLTAHSGEEVLEGEKIIASLFIREEEVFNFI